MPGVVEFFFDIVEKFEDSVEEHYDAYAGYDRAFGVVESVGGEGFKILDEFGVLGESVV